MLCTVSGSQWNSHYLETHNLTWTKTSNGTTKIVSANGEMSKDFDPKRYSIFFDPKRYFIILDIKGINKESYTSAHVLLNLLNKLGKSNKMRCLLSILLLFRNECDKFNYTPV